MTPSKVKARRGPKKVYASIFTDGTGDVHELAERRSSLVQDAKQFKLRIETYTRTDKKERKK